MTLQQANQLLDRLRDGQLVPGHLVELALMVTGDLCPALPLEPGHE